jgi:Tol biopolymer transport system component
MRSRLLILLIAVLTFGISSLSAQGFGQNKVQYKDFDWRYIQSEHFDVYFYDGGYDIARFTAEVAESAYVALQHDFQYDLAERVAIITYKSHNDFQQTNVISSYLPEGVGGVTELFKNRVVVPYEGSYSQFRHVIHHELVHAVMNDMLYGGSIQSLITGQVAQVPLWVSEGLAEFESLRWDTRLDMVVRDATLTGYLPPIEFLDYFPYQGGASVFRYIAQKYGSEKIGEILNKIKGSFSFQNAFKSAIGIDFKELTEEWQRSMKREYWPDIADRKEPSEIAKPLTDHRDDGSYFNSSAAISPQGDKLVFLSNKDGKMSIYLMDVLEGEVVRRLIKGETDLNFEELHFLEPGFGWSPDGTQITLAAKAGDSDALYIFDINRETYDQYKFDLDGIFSTSWSPVGDEIAFVGNKDGASDIYIFDIESEEIEQITDDVFSDADPSWSPDGTRLLFTSDRGSNITRQYKPSEFDMHLHDYENEDIYIINRDGSNMQRLTDAKTKEGYPIFAPDGERVAYASEQNGISNIYIHELESGQSWPITNLITGAYQMSWDQKAHKIVFTSFYRGGYDIYLLKDPLNLEPVQLEPTEYFKRLERGDDVYLVHNLKIKRQKKEKEDDGDQAPLVRDYSKYVFAEMNRRTAQKAEKITLNEAEYKSSDGDYKINRYKIKFSPDLINGAAGYSTYFGLQGFTQILLSDMLGNHQIYIGTNLVFDLRNSNISAQYWYLPNRTDWGFGAFHISNFFRTFGEGLIRFRNYGASLLMSRPFDKFTRMDFGLTWFNVNKEFIEIPTAPTEQVQTLLPSAALVHDQVEWGMTGPKNGTRASFSVLASPKYAFNSLEFGTVKFDYRRYLELFSGYSLAFRINAGTSLGRNAQRFFLGGVPNWLNRTFKGGLRINNIEDIYFSEFVTPLRGAAYYERDGNSFGLANFEFRFPLIPYLQLGFPPIRFGNIQGVAFTDIGTAWDNSDFWYATRIDENGKEVFDDIVMGYGVGARIFFLGFLVRFDVAWRYDISYVSKPIYYWSFGADF